jgi:hypothetical protein
VLDLDGDAVTVNGSNVLAFDTGLSWDIRRVEGASALSGGAFNMVFSGTGRLVVSAFGTPVVLNTGDAPTYADLQSAIAWSVTLQTPAGPHRRRGRADRAGQRRGVPAAVRRSGLRRRAGQRGAGRSRRTTTGQGVAGRALQLARAAGAQPLEPRGPPRGSRVRRALRTYDSTPSARG